jgi:hypothetical protein
MRGLTNDESTWTNPVPATKKDEENLRQYIPRLCNAYVYEKEGGQTEVPLRITNQWFGVLGWGDLTFWGDNRTRNGGLVENKASVASDGRQGIQLVWYLRYLKENGGSVDYNFFCNPAGGPVGPTYNFMKKLADGAKKYDVGIHIIDQDWWEELQ